jgi:hypothetical protein
MVNAVDFICVWQETGAVIQVYGTKKINGKKVYLFS